MLQFNFSPFPNLTTSRLLLRQITIADVDDLFLMRSDKETMRFIPRPVATEKKDVTELIERVDLGIQKNESINWAIALKESNQLIGTIGFVRSKPEHHRAEVGYMIQKEHQGKGYTFEALEKIIDYGFNEMNLNSIEAVIDPKNSASEKLLQKTKFIKEAHFKEHELWEGKYLDSFVYTRLKHY